MSFDLARIRRQIEQAPLSAPLPMELGIAAVCDLWRLAELAPADNNSWRQWARAKWPNLAQQLGMLAHFLACSDLRAASVEALGAAKPGAIESLAGFFEAVQPLTGEMVRANVFRQEEFLRRWIASLQGKVQGESADESARRLDALDYRKTLAELQEAEAARKREFNARAQALKEAAERDAAARGWRE
jgi:hypothetical protein